MKAKICLRCHLSNVARLLKFDVIDNKVEKTADYKERVEQTYSLSSQF